MSFIQYINCSSKNKLKSLDFVDSKKTHLKIKRAAFQRRLHSALGAFSQVSQRQVGTAADCSMFTKTASNVWWDILIGFSLENRRCSRFSVEVCRPCIVAWSQL